ncbi:hypothetical protein QZH41_019431 [Actinostola sp. cb2023]|nr:hypothetical protein QZH41_019431 [Actinostola sp. cb2023]
MQRMTDTEHAWIVGEMVLENRGKIPAAFPIGLLGIEYNHKEEHVGHIVDAIRVVLSGIYQLVHNKTWMAAPTGNCDNDTNITPQVLPLYGAMKKVSVVGQTGRISFTEDGYRKASRYNFINLQQNRNTRELFWQNVGYLESGHVTLEQIVWPGGVVRTPSGVPRVRLRVVMYEVAPLLYVRDFKSSLKGCQRGRDCTLVTKDKMDLLSLLSRDLDLDPEIRVIEGGRAGSITNGRWTGNYAD